MGWATRRGQSVQIQELECIQSLEGGEQRVYEPLMRLIRPFPLTKKSHAALYELKSRHPAREAVPKRKSGRLVEQTSHGANVPQ